MGASLNVNLTQTSSNESSRTATVSIVVTITSDGGTYNHYGSSSSGQGAILYVTIDGSTYSQYVTFGSSSSGTYTSTVYSNSFSISYGSSSTRTVSASARCVTGTSAGTISGSDSVSLTPINSSGGSDGDDGDNSEEWEDGNSGNTSPQSGNIDIVGHKGLTSDGSYKKDTLVGLGEFISSLTGFVIKFQTPYIGGPCTSLNISIALRGGVSGAPTIKYAICSSDYNSALYEGATATVNDRYQIISGVADYNSTYNSITFSVKNPPLKTETAYYLILWIPSETGYNDFIQISYAVNHIMDVEYINDGTGSPPNGRLPGNAFPVGQSLLAYPSENITYYPDAEYTVTYANTTIPYSYIVIIKFLTPEFRGVSTSLDVNLYNVLPGNYRDFVAQCALCTSDENNGLYIHTISDVDDVTQIACVTLSKNELSQSAMPFSIQTDKLESNRYYYLIFWVPTDKTSGGSFEIGPAKYHGINVNYVEFDKIVHIDNTSKFDKYECYIGNGSEFYKYECYIHNGSSWELIESMQ